MANKTPKTPKPAPQLSHLYVTAQHGHTSAATGLGLLLESREKLVGYFADHPAVRTLDKAIKLGRIATAQIAELANTTQMLARPPRSRK